MYSNLVEFEKKHDFLVAIDSDGCVFDTMTLKHQKFFYPVLEKELNLQEWGDELSKKWDCINLYSSLRGVNRFLGIYHLFKDINPRVLPLVYKTKIYNEFVENNDIINLEKLIDLYNETEDEFVGHIINWSQKVNEEIENHMELVDAFEESVMTIEEISKFADIAVVSSANEQALIDEWGNADLLKNISVLTSQTDGSKTVILKELISKGYCENNVLMIGDANGDREAAKANQASFRLIQAPFENKSWKNIRKELVSGGLMKYECKVQ